MDNIDELIRELEQRNRKELRWVSPEDLHISCVDVPDELCRRAAAGIRQLRQQNAELLEALHTISSVDADIGVRHRRWVNLYPKDIYELGLLDGAMAVRDAVKTEAYSVITKATGDE